MLVFGGTMHRASGPIRCWHCWVLLQGASQIPLTQVPPPQSEFKAHCGLASQRFLQETNWSLQRCTRLEQAVVQLDSD